MADQNKLTQVQAKYIDMLMAKPNVVGVALGVVREGGAPTGEKGIVVMVSKKVAQAELTAKDLIPHELDGVRVDVQEFGTFSV
jgi:hypothetical protein